MSRPGGLHAVLSLYRAQPLDEEQNLKQRRDKLAVPVLAGKGRTGSLV